MIQMNERIELEKNENIEPLLKGYNYVEHDPITSDMLKPQYFVRWIKKATDTEPVHVVLGGRIEEITVDKANPLHIYRLTIKRGNGTIFKLVLKGKTTFYLYYKTKTVVEERVNNAKEWKKNLNQVEKRKMKAMKEKRDEEPNKQKKKEITKEFYTWLYKRKPELKPVENEEHNEEHNEE